MVKRKNLPLKWAWLSLLLLFSLSCQAYEFIYGDDTRPDTPFAKDVAGGCLVIDADAPDPSVIRVADTYYAAATSGNRHQAYQRYRSKDLLTWEPMGFVFDEWPDWTCGSFWAP